MVKRLNEEEIAVIDLSVDGVYVVCNRKKELIDPPKTGYGKQVVNWYDGKPTISEVTYTQKH